MNEEKAKIINDAMARMTAIAPLGAVHDQFKQWKKEEAVKAAARAAVPWSNPPECLSYDLDAEGIAELAAKNILSAIKAHEGDVDAQLLAVECIVLNAVNAINAR